MRFTVTHMGLWLSLVAIALVIVYQLLEIRADLDEIKKAVKKP